MYKRPEDGIVLRDEGRCRGYQFCLEACPYKKIFFNHVRNVSQQCIMCFPRVEQSVAPACVRQCPGRAVWFGMLDDEEGPVAKLVHQWQVALPLHPEFGRPNVSTCRRSGWCASRDGAFDAEHAAHPHRVPGEPLAQSEPALIRSKPRWPRRAGGKSR
jgi:Fe-S-cluster-containing dehydrogenase component